MANILDQLLTVLGFKYSSSGSEANVPTHTDGLSGVGRYLAKLSEDGKKPAPAKKAKAKRAAPAKKRTASAKKTSDATNTKRCQGGTAKGDQCKRTSNLKTIQRTINGKKYRLAACSQHNNDSFKPYNGFIND
jgi:hypothetical protein